MNRIDRIKIVVQSAPESVKKTLAEAFSGTASPRRAIRAMCLSCTGYDRFAIKECSGFSCPLWAYRPFQAAGEPEVAE